MSEFWKRKMRKYFSIIDLDSDGVISRKDFVGMAIRFAKFENADKQKAELLKTHFERIWDDFVKTSDADNMGQITVDSIIDSIGKQRSDLTKHFSDLIRNLFDLMDLNCDGYLQADEYQRLVFQFGVSDPSFAKEAFKAIDVNGDGKLSLEEFRNAYLDFMFSDDEKSPNRFFLGPLDE